MPNLFPTEQVTAVPELPEDQISQVKFGRSWRFDFDTGDFVLTPAGSVQETVGVDAWLEWCKKALMTARYRYLVYGRNYGQEFDELISRHLSRAGNESEIKRIVTECLMVDPRTAAVENFTFQWENDYCYFTCDVLNVLDEVGTVTGSVVIS
jgi:hypothetical protein